MLVKIAGGSATRAGNVWCVPRASFSHARFYINVKGRPESLVSDLRMFPPNQGQEERE